MCRKSNISPCGLSAAAVAHGVNVRASISIPARKYSSAATLRPSAAFEVAAAPNMSSGMYNGRINIARSMPAPRSPTVSALTAEPIRLIAPLPSARLASSVTTVRAPSSRATASGRVSSRMGSPESSQWAAALASATTASGAPESTTSSSEPSA